MWIASLELVSQRIRQIHGQELFVHVANTKRALILAAVTRINDDGLDVLEAFELGLTIPALFKNLFDVGHPRVILNAQDHGQINAMQVQRWRGHRVLCGK